MVNPILNDATFRRLRDLICETCGIYISDAKKYRIEKKLLGRLEELHLTGFEDYLSFLLAKENGELERLFDAVTTNETYFFREPNQMSILTDVVVPQAAAKNKNTIRLWSAACSTGEEPYTIAMMLKERQPMVKADILASDISGAAIDKARAGIYGSYSTRNVPPPYLSRYFRMNGSGFELDPLIRGAVRFMTLNLTDERSVRLAAATGMDVVFLRNVLIYFDDKTKKRVVSILYDCLRPGGYLFIGTSESLHMVTRAFNPVVFNKVVVYQRA